MANHVFEKRLVSRLYKELSKLNSYSQNLIVKLIKDMKKHITIEGIRMANDCVKKYSAS